MPKVPRTSSRTTNHTSPEITCMLCERKVHRANKHHIVPKSEGGEVTVTLCLTCHKTIHRFFENHTLAKSLNTIEALQSQPDIVRYLAWVRKRPDQQISVAPKRNRL
jgi:hypothetical protein